MLARASLGGVLSLTVAALAITLPAGNGAAQVAATPGDGQMVIPESTVARPEDAGLRAHTNVELFVPAGTPAGSVSPTGGVGPQGGPPFSGNLFNTPASVACAYRLVKVASGCNPNIVTTNPTGGSHAIAIVDAYDTSATAASDLNTFIGQFGLSAANFQIIYASRGSCTPGGTAPPSSAGTGWDLETALDIEWAHAMAPSANLYLVEANSNSLTDLLAAEAVASQCVQANTAGQVSNGWGGSEFSGETAYDSSFTAANVVYFFAAGDEPGVSYPAASPNVIGVGGTTFSFGGSLPGTMTVTTAVFQGELPWNDDYIGLGTGGGPSAFEARPVYQNGISSIVDASRGTPDLGGIADYVTGVWVYSTTACGGWCIVGGTSVATQVDTGIFNAGGFFPSSSFAALTEIYTLPFRALHVTDIDTGACGVHDQYNPLYIESVTHLSWNWCTGWGTEHGQYHLPWEADAETN
jgi:kumamolisin